jgi:hypothetical protein
MWYGKANFFSLFYEISKFEDAELNWEELQLQQTLLSHQINIKRPHKRV